MLENENDFTFGDLFAGGGGTTEGALQVDGVKVIWALNHSKIAIETHKANNPDTKHYMVDIRKQDEKELAKVDGIWASLECFVKGTLIITSRGLIPIELIQKDDLVLTHKGRYKRVTQTIKKISNTIILKGQGHPGLEVTKNHPFYAVRQDKKWMNKERRNYKIFDNPTWIRSDDLYGKKKYRWATPVSYEYLHIPEVPGRGMDLEDHNFWWFVGRWLGDGLSAPERNGQISIVCGKHETDELSKKFSIFYPKGLHAEGFELRWKHREMKTADIFYCTHMHLSKWLIDNFGKLAIGKTIPTWVFSLKNEYRQSILDGYVSADGYIGPKRTQTCSISKRLSLGIRLIAESLGNRTSLHRYKQHNNIIEGRIVNTHEQWVVAWENNKTCRHSYEDTHHSWSLVKGSNLGRENVNVYNFSVKDDESYVADGIVVHNCTNYSKAKGGKPRDADSRTLAWELIRFAIHCDPKIILVENVREFMSWGPLDEKRKPVSRLRGTEYIRWIKAMDAIGYVNYDKRILNSADFSAHTKRKRYYGIFTKKGYPIIFPQPTHSKDGSFGLKKWNPCKEKIDLSDEGNSIFGRAFNKNLRKNVRRPLVSNTLERIAKGIKKYYPELFHIMKYYSKGDNFSSINEPLHTITTKETHALIKLEKKRFITEHIWGATGYQDLEEPLKPILTKEAKQLVTVEKKKQLLIQHYGGDNHASSIEEPCPTITTVDHNTLLTCKHRKQFVSSQYNSNNNPGANNQSLDDPLTAITTREKHQFITAFFNSGGKPGTQNQSIEDPLNSITTVNKHALATLLADYDFDIKMRFLTPKELADITGFPSDYKFLGSKKQVTWMIGNAVTPCISAAIISTVKVQWEKLKLVGEQNA